MDKPRSGPITIGFLNDGIRADWSLRPWEGMRQAAAVRGARAVLIDGDVLDRDNTSARHKNGLYSLASPRNLDALVVWKAILAHRISEDQFAGFLQRFPQPKVIIEGTVDGFPSVGYQNYDGMAEVVRHLIRDHGFTRLGFLGMHAHHIGFQERFRAFCDVLAQEGLEPDPKLIKPYLDQGTEHDNGILLEPIRGPWLRRALDQGIQGLVCIADSIALQVMQALEQAGARIPADVAVVGFDDFRISAMVSPAVTTARPDWERLGYEAFHLAVDMVQEKAVPPLTTIAAHLVVRQSCGCRPRALVHAENHPRTMTTEELEAALSARAAEAGLPGPAELARGLASRWTGAFPGSDPLFPYMEEQLRAQERVHPDLTVWQDLISLLEGFGGPVGTAVPDSRASRARVLAASYMDHAREFHRFHWEQAAALQSNLGVDLISSFGWEGMGRVLADNLPRVGIPGWDLVLFAGSTATEGPHRRLHVLCGRHGQARAVPPAGTEFDPAELLPEDVRALPPGTSSVVQSLHFEGRSLGYMVYHTGEGPQPVLEVLTRQISNAVEGTLLVQEAEHRSQELRNSLEQLKTTQSQLIQSEKAAVIATLVRGLSHEMNTPLGVIITAVTVLLDALKDQEAEAPAALLAQCGELILRSAEKGAHLVERIRTLNPEAFKDEQRWFDASDFFRNDFEAAAFQHRLMKTDFQYRAPEGLRLFGNPAVYHLIFTNLVENTFEHGFQGRTKGTVSVTLEVLPEGFWELVYADDGVGVSTKVLGHLFEPFGSSLENPGGQGLGTYIVQVLVAQRLGGTIQADCREGSGLLFRIRIPIPR